MRICDCISDVCSSDLDTRPLPIGARRLRGRAIMAAPVLAYENLGLIQGAGWLFRGLDVHIGPRDRLALIGRNGAGKTTFFKALAGIIDTDEGRRPDRKSVVSGKRVSGRVELGGRRDNKK